jgi:hypothetical protein
VPMMFHWIPRIDFADPDTLLMGAPEINQAVAAAAPSKLQDESDRLNKVVLIHVVVERTAHIA